MIVKIRIAVNDRTYICHGLKDSGSIKFAALDPAARIPDYKDCAVRKNSVTVYKS